MDGKDFKTCPFCKEQIQASAIKCRFCGEWLDSKPEQKPPGKTESQDEKPVETVSKETAVQASASENRKDDIAIEKSVAAHGPDISPPVIPEKETPKKRRWELTPKRLNWASAGLLTFCCVTLVLVLGGADLNGDARVKFGDSLVRTFFGAGICVWFSRKGGKGSALFVFSLICALFVAYCAYNFQIGRHAAKERDRQLAENTLDFYTNLAEFMDRGGTGSLPYIKLTGNRDDDATGQMLQSFMWSTTKTVVRMNVEMDALGKRDVFGNSALQSRQILQQEIKKRSAALEILEKYRGAIATIKGECKSTITAMILTEEDRQGKMQQLEYHFQRFTPTYNSSLKALASVEVADRDLLQFLVGAFDDYKLKDGKIMFGSDANLAQYNTLSNVVASVKAEKESLIGRFSSESEAGKAEIRSLGGPGSPKR